MESTRITGRWTGTFQEAGSATQVEFTEAVTVKSKLFAPYKLYLNGNKPAFGGSNQALRDNSARSVATERALGTHTYRSSSKYTGQWSLPNISERIPAPAIRGARSWETRK